MTLEDTEIRQLKELMKHCVAHVEGHKNRGTGFFIDRRLLLTCAHVVKDDKEVTVRPYGRAQTTGTVIDPVLEEEDLALVEVESDEQQPAVLVDPLVPDNSNLHVVGFPRGVLDQDAGLEPIPYRGRLRRAPDTTPLLLVLEEGKTVTSGLSGSPVLCLETGAVVGIVQFSREREMALGGGAILVDAAMRSLPPVRERVEFPAEASAQWRAILGPLGLRALGREPSGTRGCLDLRISGGHSKWSIALGSGQPDGGDMEVAKLGPTVPEALFQWIRGRRAHDPHEIGRLLSAALCPEPVKAGLARYYGRADQFQVRLECDPNCELGDVPWEFATVPPKPQEFFGTDRKLIFVRLVPKGPTLVPGPLTKVSVLTVLVQPPDLWPRQGSRGSLSWPKIEEVAQEMQTLGDARFDFTNVLQNPTRSNVEESLEKGVDVVHYIGLGKREKDGDLIAFCEDKKRVTWSSAEEFVHSITQGRPRIVLAEFSALPFATLPGDRMLLSVMAGMVEQGVHAFIATTFPLHPVQLKSFNRAFYKALAEGETVEGATQKARRDMRTDKPLGDATAFGSFALYTGPAAGMRLLEPKDSGGGEGVKATVDPSQRAHERAEAESRRESGDAFLR